MHELLSQAIDVMRVRPISASASKLSKLPVGVDPDEPTRMNFRNPDFRAEAKA